VIGALVGMLMDSRPSTDCRGFVTVSPPSPCAVGQQSETRRHCMWSQQCLRESTSRVQDVPVPVSHTLPRRACCSLAPASCKTGLAES
jgi:hypothetical protein